MTVCTVMYMQESRRVNLWLLPAVIYYYFFYKLNIAVC